MIAWLNGTCSVFVNTSPVIRYCFFKGTFLLRVKSTVFDHQPEHQFSPQLPSSLHFPTLRSIATGRTPSSSRAEHWPNSFSILYKPLPHPPATSHNPNQLPTNRPTSPHKQYTVKKINNRRLASREAHTSWGPGFTSLRPNKHPLISLSMPEMSCCVGLKTRFCYFLSFQKRRPLSWLSGVYIISSLFKTK